jgi:hypothetical protein
MTRRLLLLSLALLLAAPATASAELKMFRSPSGKLGCAFFRETAVPPEVRCDWRGGGDHAVRVGLHGKARRIHVTDTVLDPDAKVLPYGETKRFHGLKCKSRRTGITCKSTKSGHGFKVSVEKRELF